MDRLPGILSTWPAVTALAGGFRRFGSPLNRSPGVPPGMERIPGYVHQNGRHCGSTALANLAEFYGWDYDEAACFGLGTGVWAATFDHPQGAWNGLLARPPWLETEFFETLGVPYLDREEADFQAAWTEVTDRLDADHPVLLFLDPTALPGVQDGGHVAPHVAVAIGYGDDAVLLSDPAAGVRELPLAALRTAWRDDRYIGADHRHLVVTDPQQDVDEVAAANRAIRRTTGYMLEPYDNERVYGTYGADHGVAGLRSFADEVARWPDLDRPDDAALYANRPLAGRADGAGFRRLYADGLDLLAADADLGIAYADRMRTIADEWESAVDSLQIAARTDDEARRHGQLEEAASVFGSIAEAEADYFEDLREGLRQ